MSESQPTRLLLVEDDEVFSRVLVRTLEQRDYAVMQASSRDEAEVLLGKHNLDYAILDLNLGGETSLGLIKPLLARNPTMRILVLTGYASIATAVEAIKLGAHNYLAKPADADEILTALSGQGNATEAADTESSKLEPMSVRRLEWEHIQKVLQENAGNISVTARQLKMHRRTLQRKLQKKPVAR